MFESVRNMLGARHTASEPMRVEPSMMNQATITSSDAVGMAEIFGGEPTYAGAAVTPQSAMRVSAVYACVRLIAGAKASLPAEIYQIDSGSRDLVDHDYLDLLNEEPSPVCSAAVFWEYAESSRHLYGDGFAYIVRNRNGVPIELLPIHPLRVRNEKVNGRIVYYISFEDGTYRGVDQDDMLQFCNFGWDGLRSMSTIRWAARQGIGIAIAAEQHTGNFFRNGVKPSVVLEYAGTMKQELVEQLRAEFDMRYSGSDNSHRPMILTGGVKGSTLTMNAADAQLLESRKFQVIDIARAFGVPPFMIGESEKQSSWGSGMSEMSQAFINYTLGPHLVRDEQELNRKLFRIGRYKAVFNRRALLSFDLEKLGAYYRQAIGGSQGPGWLTINEVRRYDNLSPNADGGTLFNPVPTAGADRETKPAA